MKLKIVGVLTLLMTIAAIVTSCQTDAQLDFKRYYSTGSIVYQTHCQNCHNAAGDGLGALIPPLNYSVYLKNNKQQLACFIKYGINNAITVNKKAYQGAMPAQTDLSPIEIAQVITYINNSFGNNLGLTDVQAVEADLKKCK